MCGTTSERVSLPLPLSNFADHLRRQQAFSIDVQYQILSVGHMLASVGSSIYGLAAAWLAFYYLFTGKSANFYAALPVRREAMFATHYLAGLTIHIVPMLLISAVTFAASAMVGAAARRVRAGVQRECAQLSVFL